MIDYLFQTFSSQEMTGISLKNRMLKKKILLQMVNEGHTTIPELAKMMKLSIPKTTDLLNELLKEKIALNLGKDYSNGGRKPSIYGINAGAALFIGVHVKKDRISIGLMDLGRHVHYVEETKPYQLENTLSSLNTLCDFVNNFVEDKKIDRNKIQGLGLNLSGRVNALTGHSYSYFNFSERPLSRFVGENTGFKVHLENDARAQAFGDYNYHWKSKCKNVLYLYLDYGIGMGIIINGRLYYGKSGFSGEMGHMPFFDNEILCVSCGKKGCLESECAGWALLSMFREEVAKGSTTLILQNHKKAEDVVLEDIVQGVIDNDTLCIDLIARVGFKLGKAIAALINIFNPELIVLGGCLSEVDENLLYPVKSAVQKYALNLMYNDTNIVIEKSREESGVYGAALLSLNQTLGEMPFD